MVYHFIYNERHLNSASLGSLKSRHQDGITYTILWGTSVKDKGGENRGGGNILQVVKGEWRGRSVEVESQIAAQF